MLPVPVWGMWSVEVETACSWSGRVGPLNGILGWPLLDSDGAICSVPPPFPAILCPAVHLPRPEPLASKTIPSQPLAKIKEWAQELLEAQTAAERKVKGFGSQFPSIEGLKYSSATRLASSTRELWCPAQHMVLLPCDPQLCSHSSYSCCTVTVRCSFCPHD